MWFEGSVLAKEFPARLVELMQTTPPGESEPMWSMISSNVGSSLSDNGYVLHSTGTSGQDDIFIGVKNDFHHSSYWHYGHRFFIAENYIPAASEGTNGELTNELYCGHRYHFSDNWGGTSVNTLIIDYKISVTKDRVIITTFNNVSLTRTESMRTLTYLGLMKRYSHETDSTASVIATNYDTQNNAYNSIRVLRNKQLVVGDSYNPRYTGFLQLYGLKGWGKKFFATHIPLHHSSEGYRGELDGMLVAAYSNDLSYQGRTLPEYGTVTIEGKEYLCLHKPYQHGSMHNNFDHGGSSYSYAYLIEKG